MKPGLVFKWFVKHFEVMVWVSALVLLYTMPVSGNEPSFCPFRFITTSRCPGCGIGHSIHDALHLSFTGSFRRHPMGIPAVIIIFIRIKQLLFPPKQTA